LQEQFAKPPFGVRQRDGFLKANGNEWTANREGSNYCLANGRWGSEGDVFAFIVPEHKQFPPPWSLRHDKTPLASGTLLGAVVADADAVS